MLLPQKSYIIELIFMFTQTGSEDNAKKDIVSDLSKGWESLK